MTFENISKNAVLNAGGRLLDPGAKIPLNVEYYAQYKDFIDSYVERKLGKLTGMEEYEDFIKNGGKKEEPEVEKVDLMEEVRAEEEAAAKEAEAKAKAEEDKADEAEEKAEAPKKKTTTRRRKPAAKKTDSDEA